MIFLKNKKGQSAIELAIIFPLLAMLMIYLFDVAMVISAKMTTNAACRAYIRTITLHGAPSNPNDYFEKTGKLGKTARQTAESILNQNGYQWSSKYSFKTGLKPIKNALPSSKEIKEHAGDNPEGRYMITMRICTEVPIRLNKIMGVEIWGKNEVQDGKLPVCSQYISAISSRASSTNE